MTRALVVALASLALGGCGGGAALLDSPPKPSGLNPQLARTLQATLEKTAGDLGVPGAAAAVVFADGSAWAGGTGAAVLKPRAEATTATAFGYRSVTKTFFAALTLKLAERGRLRLDDRVVKWVPSWRGDRDATVRDLLRHTAGTPRDLPDRAWRRILSRPRSRWTPTQVLALAPRPGPRSSAPEYSNLDYNLVGLVTARAAGAPAATALRREVLAPLGLRGIAYAPEGPVPRPVASGYVYPHGLGDPVAATDGGYRLTAIDTAMGTAGALYGSAESLARFGHLLFGGRLLEPASLRQMVRFEPLSGGQWDGYGLGVAHQTVDGHEVWGHEGDGFGMHAELWHLPKEHLTVATLWNDDAIKDPTLPRALLDAALSRP